MTEGCCHILHEIKSRPSCCTDYFSAITAAWGVAKGVDGFEGCRREGGVGVGGQLAGDCTHACHMATGLTEDYSIVMVTGCIA